MEPTDVGNFIAHFNEDDDGGGSDCDFSSAPAWACSYCGIADPQSVAMCIDDGKWFCNARMNTSASHIVNHLVRSKKKTIELHPESDLGTTTLECYNCGNKNVFLLGFVSSSQDNVVIILCREPCLSSAHLKEKSNWNLENWSPVIQDRAFLNWMLKDPRENFKKRQRLITGEQISALEEFWKKKPDATLEDLEKPGADDAPTPVQLRYPDAFHYQHTFSMLIKLEAEYDRKAKEAQAKSEMVVRWEQGLNRRWILYFSFGLEDNEARVVVGDELKVSHPGQKWEGMGPVIRITANEEVGLELRPSSAEKPVPNDLTEGFRVEYNWKPVSFDRMQEALRLFAMEQTSVAAYLYHKLLGHEVPDQVLRTTSSPSTINAPGLAPLNQSQIAAVQKAVTAPICLIQGPPGTGKTVTSATIVYHLVKLNEGAQTLVCAPSNVAVDQLAERIHKTGLKVVRLCAKSRESIQSPVEYLTLHDQLTKLDGHHYTELCNLLKLRQEQGELSMSDETRFRKIKLRAEKDILKTADVICTTCVGAGDSRLSQFRFKHVLIDEATQATEPECMIPIMNGTKQVILVGDHCQLGPVIMCKTAAKAGVCQSLFERLLYLNNRPIRLEVQYRMHPALSEFPSVAFYEGSLQNGVTAAERVSTGLDFQWPKHDVPMFFYNSEGREECSASGTSFLNRAEAGNVEKIVRHLVGCGVKASQIGVITPYEGQRAHLTCLFMKSGGSISEKFNDMEVASVDAFQGREKDFIILSCVRSNNYQGIGFLNDSRRLNVALTRAKYGLVICGNARVLSKPRKDGSPTLWGNLLGHFKKHEVVVEGSIAGGLKQLAINFPTTQGRLPGRKHVLDSYSQRHVMDTYSQRHMGNGVSSDGSYFSQPRVTSQYDPDYDRQTFQRQSYYPPYPGGSGGCPAEQAVHAPPNYFPPLSHDRVGMQHQNGIRGGRRGGRRQQRHINNGFSAIQTGDNTNGDSQQQSQPQGASGMFSQAFVGLTSDQPSQNSQCPVGGWGVTATADGTSQQFTQQLTTQEDE
eukprot:GHVL01040223.1.p1 GENE.GHVL01040223.1~~GHVL01040223.1.p1  ORF type:complete len:1030 (+),score=215.97 GHVL01040223.1:85-3174(+)